MAPKNSTITTGLLVVIAVMAIISLQKGFLFQGAVIAPGDTFTFAGNITDFNRTLAVTSENCNVASLAFIPTIATTGGKVTDFSSTPPVDVWVQGSDAGQLITLDLCPRITALNTSSGDLTLGFHAETGSIVVSSIQASYFTTNAYRQLCTLTGGFMAGNDTCDCRSDVASYVDGQGCQSNVGREGTQTTTGNEVTATTMSASNEAAVQQLIAEQQAQAQMTTQKNAWYNNIPWTVWVMGIAAILYAYYVFFERGPGGLFKKF